MSVSNIVSGDKERLIEAVKTGDAVSVESMLSKGADPNTTDSEGRPLLSCLTGDYPNVVKVLLRYKANPNRAASKEEWEYMPLHYASEDGFRGVVHELLVGGADVSAKNVYGHTALMLASIYGHLEVVRELISGGADVNAKGDFSYTSLMFASMRGHPEVVRELLAKGADVNARLTLRGETSLTYASKNGHLEVVRELLAGGADVNATLKVGSTSLTFASDKGHLEVVRELLAKGADVNAEMENGSTSLIFASDKGHLEVVRELLAKGADVNAENLKGETALTSAGKNGHLEVVRELEKYMERMERNMQFQPVPAKDSEGNPTTNNITYDEIQHGNTLVDWGREKFGQYFKKSTYNSLHPKIDPFTRERIRNPRFYKANLTTSRTASRNARLEPPRNRNLPNATSPSLPGSVGGRRPFTRRRMIAKKRKSLKRNSRRK